ncbi:MAG: hypothetical protein NVSMB22_27470 [Chloroflexota bacterium]
MDAAAQFCRACGLARERADARSAPADGDPQSSLSDEPSRADLLARLSLPQYADKVPWGWVDLLKTLGLFFVIGVGGAIFFAVVHSVTRHALDGVLPVLRAWGVSPTLGGIGLSIVGFYAALALAIYLCIVKKYRPPLQIMGFRRASRADFAFALLAWPVVAITAGTATTVMAHFFLGGHFSNPQTGQYTHTGSTHTIASLLVLMLPVAVVVPAVEETLFRGLLYPVLRRRWSVWIAMPTCAGVFALAHLIPILLPFTFTLGLALTLIFARTRSLYPGMMLHGAQNAVFAIAIWASFPG